MHNFQQLRRKIVDWMVNSKVALLVGDAPTCSSSESTGRTPSSGSCRLYGSCKRRLSSFRRDGRMKFVWWGPKTLPDFGLNLRQENRHKGQILLNLFYLWVHSWNVLEPRQAKTCKRNTLKNKAQEPITHITRIEAMTLIETVGIRCHQTQQKRIFCVPSSFHSHLGRGGWFLEPQLLWTAAQLQNQSSLNNSGLCLIGSSIFFYTYLLSSKISISVGQRIMFW